ncbi:MAG: GlcG/HbpS family heme-binding protein [Nitrospira sp.]|nr:heme-binding protein [Nitrospira sp.]
MESFKWLSLFTVIGLLHSPTVAVAEDLPREAVLPMRLAEKAAAVAVEKCAKDGYKVTAAVVDKAGGIRVQLRGDGASPHTVDSSRKKAYTASSTGRATSEWAELMVKAPHLHSLGKMNENILMLGGGLPIQIGNEVVGGIGVGGAPGTHLDDACAQAGLDAIGAAHKAPAGQ